MSDAAGATTATATDAAGAAAGGAQGAAPAGAAAPTAPAAGQQQGTDTGAAGAGEGAPPWADNPAAVAEIARLRGENAAARTTAKAEAAQEAVAAERARLAKLLNPDAADNVTPEQLTHSLTEVGAARDAAERRTAILEAAWAEGIDRTKLGYLEYELGRDAKLAAVSHTADEFGATPTAAIQARVSADPSLKSPGAITTTGAEQFAGGGGAEAVTKAQFDAMSIQERTKLYLTDRATYDRLVNL